jgi:hypothetical protein
MAFIRHMGRSAFSQAGRPDNGNYLESGGIRGNMLTRQTLWGICLGVNTLADVLVFDEIPYNPI